MLDGALNPNMSGASPPANDRRRAGGRQVDLFSAVGPPHNDAFALGMDAGGLTSDLSGTGTSWAQRGARVD
jgi:hypothetical protein